MGFIWRIEVAGFGAEQAVQVRHDNAASQGVPLPENWKVAVQCVGFPQIAIRAAEKLQADVVVEKVECVMLGRPRLSPLPDPTVARIPGALVNLLHEDAQKDFLLAAHINGDKWYCHGGGFEEDPFNAKGLCIKDIALDATRKVVRRRKSHKTSDLRSKAISNSEAWSACVACASWEAAIIRAEGRPLDLASAGFGSNPFLWETDGWLSHAEVTFAWSWLVRGEWRRELVRARTDDLTVNGRGIPRPASLRNDDEAILADLIWPTKDAALCKYLGQRQGDRYEPDPAKWRSGTKTKQDVWYEWQHVLRGVDRVPHRVTVSAHKVLHGTCSVPHSPLDSDAPSNLYFTLDFFQALADWKCPGTVYEGISYEGDKPEIKLEIPDGGTDIQDYAVHWTLPCGRSECWSLRELKDARPDQLAARDANEAYEGIAREMAWDVFGTTDDAAVAAYREDPGTLEEKKWLQLEWSIPKKETAPCWWLVNPKAEPTKQPSLLSRSLACLRLELRASRVASSAKLRQTHERRSEGNSKAVDVLHQNQHLWNHAGGPEPELLFAPTSHALEGCRIACERLERLRITNDGRDGLDEYVSEIKQAVDTLKRVEWEVIRTEKFSMTPPALYSDLVRNAECLLYKRASELIRRQEWLAAPVEELSDRAVTVKAGRADKYGIDLNVFKMKGGRKPRTWKQAVRIASWVHIDEMRTLLELHYDDVHFTRWKRKDGKAPLRKGEHTVLNKVAAAYRSKLCQRLVLPKSIKDILHRPTDEDSWAKLEQLRKAIALEVEGEELFFVATQEEADAVAAAIVNYEPFFDVVGAGCKIPAGARVLVDGATTKEDVVREVHNMANSYLHVLKRPFGTCRAPPVDGFCRRLEYETAEEIGTEMGKEKLLDNMLLCLFDAMFLKQSELWSAMGVANTPADETPEIAKYFMKGIAVGAKSIFDAICSQCGTLLHGFLGNHSALSNKVAGPPLDRDGALLVEEDGSPKVNAQPPFLLRFSPSLFAKEAPAMFKHDEETNRLSLQEGRREPWLRVEHHSQTSADSTWLYCRDCVDRYFDTGKRARGHLPYRDRASQSLMRRPQERERVQTDTQEPSQEEPEHEPESPEQVPAPDVPEEEEEALPAETFPCLEEYQAKWARGLTQHSKAVPGEFGRDNLVPNPIHELWQDCPYVPFDKLKSDDAMARLSRTRPISGFTPAHVEDGVVRYAHNTGETNFRRRAPLQLAATLGFILNSRSGKFLGLTPEEKEALHECLTWLRQPGNNSLCFYGAELEAFDGACKRLMRKIQKIIPEALIL